MKTLIKTFMICFISLTSVNILLGQEINNERYTIERARVLLRKTYNPKVFKKAVSDIKKYVAEENPEAMHLLGMTYSSGIGGAKDYSKSIYWFEKASAKGYLGSNYNLAMMYRRGLGVEQDFETAYKYLQKVADSNHMRGLYGLAYFHYKGLGCEQSYEKAVKYFEAAAKQGHPHATFMLGLCYRNGYGTERDIPLGNMWLKKAGELGVKSDRELNADSPERPLQSVKLRSLSIPEDKVEHHKIIRHTLRKNDEIEGNYAGTLITYDWSGQYILKESPLEVEFLQNGNEISIIWQEEDATYMEARGILSDSALVFTKASYFRKDHFNKKTPREWNMIKATLTPTRENDQMSLNGNLQLYTPETKEPGKPMYLVLKPRNSAESNSVEIITQNTISNVMVYPNPFGEFVNISFNLSESKNCALYVYSMLGSMLYQQQLGELQTGSFRYQIPLDVPVGNYLFKLVCGDDVYTSIIY